MWWLRKELLLRNYKTPLFGEFLVLCDMEIVYKDKIVIIDEEDLSTLKNNSWHFDTDNYLRRIVRKNKKQTVLKFHREIMNCPKEKICDHINRNRLDNRKENLRICGKIENDYNRGKRCDNTSGSIGVHWHKYKNGGVWMARIGFGKSRKYLGVFKRKEDAIKMYNDACKINHGEFAVLNSLK